MEMNPAGLAIIEADNIEQVLGKNVIDILILPAFGIISQIVASLTERSIFGYLGMVYAWWL